MRGLLACAGAFYAIGLLAGCHAHSPAPAARLITGKFISPTTRSSQDVGSLPMNLALSPDGRYVISSDMGHYQSLWSTRLRNGKGVSHVDFPNYKDERLRVPAGEGLGDQSRRSIESNGLYYGLAISDDNIVYAAQGAHDRIAILQLAKDGTLNWRGAIATRRGDFPAGLALDARGMLYVSNNAAGGSDPYRMSGSVAIYDPPAKKELGRYTFSQSHGGTSNFPLGLAAIADGSKVYVAAERDDAVYVLDTHDPARPALRATLHTGAHPVSVLLSRDQSRLYVANSLSDTISIVDTKADRIISTVLLRPAVAKDLPGVTPTALALSPDQKTLYAALGDMNAIAVIDPDDAALRGYIPTGWYPSAVTAAPDGKRLLVANAKGFNARNPDNHPDPRRRHSKYSNTLTVLEGNVSAVPIPTGDELEKATAQVMSDNRLDKLAQEKESNPLAGIGLSAGKIRHVFYIIKENRTYDQILGDMPQGNGDESLVLFGRDVTPNQHALAERFVLLDNLYACGEVSGDGWDWSTQGMANGYVVRNIPYNYSNRGRKFDEEGQNNGYPTAGAPATNPVTGKPWKHPSFRKAAKPIPDVANTGRNIWDAAHDAGISLRNYGFFLSFDDTNAGVPGCPDNYPGSPGLLPAGHDLNGNTDLDYRRFDLNYADSDLPEKYFKQTGDKDCLYSRRTYGAKAMPCRYAEWHREFEMMLAKHADGSAVPALTLIRLPQNHTAGAQPGHHTPRSMVADNDYALAEIVHAISTSPIWTSSAIFVIEDDAQAGVDHVDCHRTTGFVISPWIKAHSVDHHFYNTDSFLKTIELLVGLHPLSQYDAVADPILDWDSAPSNIAPYEPIVPPKELIAERNPRVSALKPGDPRVEMARQSQAMDLTHDDAAPAQKLNEIIWQTVRGPESKMPAPRGFATGQDADD
jgi:YVTN family beta-propeller protein